MIAFLVRMYEKVTGKRHCCLFRVVTYDEFYENHRLIERAILRCKLCGRKERMEIS